MYKELIDNIKPDLDKTLEYLKGEIGKLRVGRATPAMVEDIEIECYDQKMSLKEVANISIQPRLIIVQPWDKKILENIEKGISKFSSGLTPTVDGEIIRINIPQLSEERRKELIKILNEKTEEARISIRHKREEAWKEIQELERKGEIREDDKFRGKDELQKIIDDYNKQVEELKKNKESDILTV